MFHITYLDVYKKNNNKHNKSMSMIFKINYKLWSNNLSAQIRK